MEHSPAAHATSVALNSDIVLEKRPHLDPAIPLHFETFCSQVLVSKTPEAQTRNAASV